MTGFPVNIGEYVVLHLTKQAKEDLLIANQTDGVFDFSDYDENDVSVVAEFQGIGQGEVV